MIIDNQHTDHVAVTERIPFVAERAVSRLAGPARTISAFGGVVHAARLLGPSAAFLNHPAKPKHVKQVAGRDFAGNGERAKEDLVERGTIRPAASIGVSAAVP
jgi:hypothetical protein